MKPSLLLLVIVFNCFLLLPTVAFSQGVAVNTDGSTADPSATLDIKTVSPYQGVLIARVPLASATDVATIANPAASLLVYNTATAGTSPNDIVPGFYYWNSTKWSPLGGSGTNWFITGNIGSTASNSAIGVPVNNNFIGTTDAKDFVVASNNLERFRVASSGNIGIGTTTPNASASLDVTSTTTGVLIPRMTTAQRDAITTPATGLQVFNTDCNALNYYTGTCWVSISKGIPTPGAISGNTDICSGTTQTYNIAAVSGATSYTWTVPAGTIIYSGQGTISINVTIGGYSGNVCVDASNSCESSNARCISVNIKPLPDTPGSISGVTTVYPNQTGVTYSISGSGSYTWSVPSGVTITSGQGTNSIIANFACNAASGNISVTGSNACGSGSASSLAVTVTTLVASAGNAITGHGTIGGSPTATAGTSPYTYSWSPTTGLSSNTAANPLTQACANTTYTVTVTDAHTCTASSSVVVTQSSTGCTVAVLVVGGGDGATGVACWMGAGGIGGADPLGLGVAGVGYPGCGGYGAGGGGYNGGGGGGQGGNTPCSDCEPGCGGGTDTLSGPSTSNGVRSGNGQVIITY